MIKVLNVCLGPNSPVELVFMGCLLFPRLKLSIVLFSSQNRELTDKMSNWG